jgi:hypothetical protein
MSGMNLRGREDELFPPLDIYKFFMARGFRGKTLLNVNKK